MLVKYLTVLFCSLSMVAFGQGNEKMVIAKYKYGVLYIGEKISENEESVTIRLKNDDNILDDKYENVITLDKSKPRKYYDSNNALIFEKGKYHKTKGLYFTYALGFGSSSAQTELGVGFRFKKRFAVGLGVGIDYNDVIIDNFWITAAFSTIYADARYYLTNGKRRVFASGKLGYGIALQDQFRRTEVPTGGLKVNLGLGVQFCTRKDISYWVSIENNFQKTSGTNFFNGPFDDRIEVNYDIWIKRLVLKFAVEI